MVRTLGTLERRLGIATSAYIQYHFLCPVCWFRHPPDQPYKLSLPNCTNSGCPGVLYTVKQNATHQLVQPRRNEFPRRYSHAPRLRALYSELFCGLENGKSFSIGNAQATKRGEHYQFLVKHTGNLALTRTFTWRA
ncbi:hypothetical protein BOTBODRAFT_507261 [Botryobasidium botryosum FD-172 SS1]|uniref:Uncharacterized protein n=1 Tax=Botryobasidium botryosum (strain FD-172 SS1) TaxID=930990 RepID=A0A067M315_BOTB1|nr:hypothetical protein BOTBODRAFT_507261 [Botryobasidium botryosum FD-172 SS1]